jgi:hypothetical protein
MGYSYPLRQYYPGTSGRMLDIHGTVTAIRDITAPSPIPEPASPMLAGIALLALMYSLHGKAVKRGGAPRER